MISQKFGERYNLWCTIILKVNYLYRNGLAATSVKEYLHVKQS